MSQARPPGLQQERTALAWTRTALAMLAVGGFLVKVGASSPDGFTSAAGVLLLPAALLAWLSGRRRADEDDVSPAAAAWSIRAAAAITAITVVAAALTAIGVVNQ